MFGHAKAIAALKELNKPRVTHFSPPDHVKHMNAESDRSFIVLNGSMVDDSLLIRLEKMMSGLNSDELSRFFHFEGPGGTFSSRIKLAQGLGLVNRATGKHLDMIREMRNVAAHSNAPLTFDTRAIRLGVMSFYSSAQAAVMKRWECEYMRFVYGLNCSVLCTIIDGDTPEMSFDDGFEMTKAFGAGAAAAID